MRTVVFCLLAYAGLATAASSCYAQDQPSVGESISTLQGAIVRILKKNGTYTDDSFDNWISEVSFMGCNMRIRSERSRSVLYSAGPGYHITSTATFDLFDIDPSDITERISTSGKVRTMRLNTIDSDEVVSYIVRSRYETTSTMEKSVSITVHKKVLPELKGKMIELIRLCQQMPEKQKGL